MKVILKHRGVEKQMNTFVAILYLIITGRGRYLDYIFFNDDSTQGVVLDFRIEHEI